MNIETTKDLNMLLKMKAATMSHIERLEDIAGLEDLKADLERIEIRGGLPWGRRGVCWANGGAYTVPPFYSVGEDAR